MLPPSWKSPSKITKNKIESQKLKIGIQHHNSNTKNISSVPLYFSFFLDIILRNRLSYCSGSNTRKSKANVNTGFSIKLYPKRVFEKISRKNEKYEKGPMICFLYCYCGDVYQFSVSNSQFWFLWFSINFWVWATMGFPYNPLMAVTLTAGGARGAAPWIWDTNSRPPWIQRYKVLLEKEA